MAYSDYITKAASEKVMLAWVEPAQQLVGWTLDSGSIYQKAVDYYVIEVKESQTVLTEVASKAAITSSGEWFFDSVTKVLYVRTTGDVNPGTIFIVATYRQFFSDAPYNLPYDLASGREVEYESRILGVTKLSSKLDHEDQTGIALEGSSSISFHNDDNFFKTIYDKLTYENKRVRAYSWSPELTASQAKLYYEGFIEAKSYTSRTVSFKIKDFIFKLREQIPLNLFTTADGTLADSVIGTPKRRVYGRVSGLQLTHLDLTKDGFTCTGTISGTGSSTTVTGVGTIFLSEISPEDELTIGTQELRVESIASDTSLVVTETISVTFSTSAFTCFPFIPYDGQNRNFLVADHAIREATTTVSSATQTNRLVVADSTDFEADDKITVGSEQAEVLRVSTGDLIVLKATLSSVPAVSTTVIKNPIQNLYIRTKLAQLTRDYTVTNTTECRAVLTSSAEFNLTRPSPLAGTVTFTITDRNVTGSSTRFTTELNVRDFIKPTSTSTWYEILAITDDTNLVLRVAFAESTGSYASHRKDMDYVDDDAIISVECLGKTTNGIKTGPWIKTGSDIVKDLLIEAGLTSQLNASSFSNSSIDAPYVMGIALPLTIRSDAPKLRDVIDKVSQSIFGSIHNNDAFEIEFNVVSPKKPTGLTEYTDDDIIKFSISSQGRNIAKTVAVKYKFQDVDRFTERSSFSIVQFTNTTARDLIGSVATKTVNSYIFKTGDATTIAQRKSFFSQAAQSIVKITAKLIFAEHNINDKLKLRFNRLYDRLGHASDNAKIGIISGIKRGPRNIEITVDDLGNIFNKVSSIMANSSNEYTSATDDEKLVGGYITNSDGLLGTDEATNGINLIG